MGNRFSRYFQQIRRYGGRHASFIKKERKQRNLTQVEFAKVTGLGLRFVRELEHGKETLRMDKVNKTLSVFGMEAVPGIKEREPLD